MTTQVTWQEPPARPKQTYTPDPETIAIIEALQANPGKWALIKTDTYPNITSRWKKRPGIEAKSSNVGKDNGKWDVYARYIGEAA